MTKCIKSEVFLMSVPTAFPSIAERVYRNGFSAELMGKTSTAVQAYTSPGITWLVRARIPAFGNKIAC